MRMTAAVKANPNNLRATCPAGARSGNRARSDAPGVRFFCGIDLSTKIQIRENKPDFSGWEGDLMIFERSQGAMNIGSLIEQKTRIAVLSRNNDRISTHFINKVMDVMGPLPQPARKSITFDRGFEFRAWRKLKSGIGSESWFCDPRPRPSEKR